MSAHDDGAEVRLGGGLEVLRVIWALDHALQRASRVMQSAHGVTGPQRLAIRIIGRFPGISAGRLAKVLHVHPSTLTGILARLQRRKLIASHPDPRDGRRTLLGLTAAGRLIDAHHEGTIEAIVDVAMADIDTPDLDAARRVLEKLAAALSSDD